MPAKQSTQLEPVTFAEAIAGVRLIPLSRGRYAIVDVEDVALIAKDKWSCGNHGYAMRGVKSGAGRKYLLMHRVLSDAPQGMEVDHRNGCRLDNRRSNLRHATRGENARNTLKPVTNTSGIKGVHLNKRTQKWMARARCNGKIINLGAFTSKEDAASAYDAVAKVLHGEFYRPA